MKEIIQMFKCKNIGCKNCFIEEMDFCEECKSKSSSAPIRISDLYPKYYKDVSQLTEVDVYLVHQLFDIQDPSGCIQHASKKLLLSGVRTGGKSHLDDIREARDTLNRWLEIQTLMP